MYLNSFHKLQGIRTCNSRKIEVCGKSYQVWPRERVNDHFVHFWFYQNNQISCRLLCNSLHYIRDWLVASVLRAFY